jgi:hypothetical protein
MAHEREAFPILENASQQGVVASSSQNGDASAGKIGLTSWVFKDSAGNLVHPTLTTEGKIQVTSEGAGVPKSASSDGEIPGSLTETLICEVALTPSKTHGKIHANLSCFKEAIAYLVQQDDATETIIGHIILGPGQYSFHLDLKTKEFVSGATGTQKLILRAKNLAKASDFLGDISCLEFAV